MVLKSRMVIDVLNIKGLQLSFKRLGELLAKIQKALGKYLERERMSFPRFYFIGDEELLEIIRNSKNISRLQKHFKKIFVGVSAVILDESSTNILGVSSCEGEEVIFTNPVSILDHPKVYEWLTLIEKEIRLTLALRLGEAVTNSELFKQETIDHGTFVEWCDKYQTQIVVLSVQIVWSKDIETALHHSQEHYNNENDSASKLTPLENVLTQIETVLNFLVLVDFVLQKQPPLRRKKLEYLVCVYYIKLNVLNKI